jgi:hypothetical protein
MARLCSSISATASHTERAYTSLSNPPPPDCCNSATGDGVKLNGWRMKKPIDESSLWIACVASVGRP